MRFNVNNHVRVRLTPAGIAALCEDHNRLRKALPSIGEFKAPETDAEGWSRWQLWNLMAELGHHIFMGGPVPFETEIEIECETPASVDTRAKPEDATQIAASLASGAVDGGEADSETPNLNHRQD